jgi:hypothetical protein
MIIVYKCLNLVFLADLGPLGAQPGLVQVNNQQGMCSMLAHCLYSCFPVFVEVLEYIVFFSWQLYSTISITTTLAHASSLICLELT